MIREYTGQHTDVTDQLDTWYITVKQSDWANFNEVREMFGSVDFVGNDLYVFNI